MKKCDSFILGLKKFWVQSKTTVMGDGARVTEKSQSILSHSQCLRRQEPSELAEPLSVRRAARP
jgi:hypothetical protein